MSPARTFVSSLQSTRFAFSPLRRIKENTPSPFDTPPPHNRVEICWWPHQLLVLTRLACHSSVLCAAACSPAPDRFLRPRQHSHSTSPIARKIRTTSYQSLTHTHHPLSPARIPNPSRSSSCRQVVVRESERGEPCGGGSLPWPWWVWRRTRWQVGAGRPVAGVLQKFSARTPAPGQTTALARMAETDRQQTSATMERTALIAGHEVRPLPPTLSLSSLSDSHPLPQC